MLPVKNYESSEAGGSISGADGVFGFHSLVSGVGLAFEEFGKNRGARDVELGDERRGPSARHAREGLPRAFTSGGHREFVGAFT